MGAVRTELIDLIRAIARSDWPTVDRLWPELNGPGGEEVLKASFGIAVTRRFSPEASLTEVADFVRALRAEYETEDDKISQTEAEVLIRITLGEADLAEEVNWDTGVSTLVVILGKLLGGAQYSDLDLERYLHEVEALAAKHVA